MGDLEPILGHVDKHGHLVGSMVINRKDPQGINLTQDGHPKNGSRYGEISTTWFYQVCVRMVFLSLSLDW